MTLEALLEKYKGQHISYSQYLITDEWAAKRDEIIKRDSFCCTNCKKSATIDNIDLVTKKPEHIWIEDNGVIDLGGDIPSANYIIVTADKHYHLEVHHNRYIFNRLPWEYNNEDLVTFCNHCHTDFHNTNKVLVFSEDELVELEYEACSKCNGTGYIPQYNHVQGGVCFQCMGNRYTQPLIS